MIRLLHSRTLLTVSLLPLIFYQPAQAQLPVYCQQTPEAIGRKDTLRQRWLQKDRNAQQQYRKLIAEQADRLTQCRSRTWPRTEGIWLRLYPCDAKPGRLEEVLDRMVDRGYNQVNVEVFYNGQVLLPRSDNSTVWASVLQAPGYERVDLLAEIIRKGRERGLKVYAWMFSLNFGYSYSLKPDRQAALARNGYGQTSLTMNSLIGAKGTGEILNPEETFVDPYHPQVRQDYLQLLQAISQRQPDGILFDYIRYPRNPANGGLASRVQDLWIYGEASLQALYRRANNRKGQELIRRYVNRGSITEADLQAIAKLYPNEAEPEWQGHNGDAGNSRLPLSQQRANLEADLNRLTVGHAMQGIVDFLRFAVAPVQAAGIAAGAVFFPEGNQVVGNQGFDSRLQPWDRFPPSLEWHPMAYGVCGNPSCIVAQVQRVLRMAPANTQVKPVLAGIWQESTGNHPPLELQMAGLQQAAPQLTSISHFAYSWQEPQSDRDRKFCRLR